MTKLLQRTKTLRGLFFWLEDGIPIGVLVLYLLVNYAAVVFLQFFIIIVRLVIKSIESLLLSISNLHYDNNDTLWIKHFNM
jgi:hypothetical protein